MAPRRAKLGSYYMVIYDVWRADNEKDEGGSRELTSINFVMSWTFSLFLSLKASRASLYSFSYDRQYKTSSVVLFDIVRYNNWDSQNATSSYMLGNACPHSYSFPPNLTFFWQVCPRGFNSLFTASIFLRTCATSFLIGSAKASSSWCLQNFISLTNTTRTTKTNSKPRHCYIFCLIDKLFIF